MRPQLLCPLLIILAVLAAGCEQKAKIIPIADARAKAALTLSAFECSLLAPAQAENSRLFNVGLLSGREFLQFAEANPNGYSSIQPQIDPIWAMVAARPSADFKLGELYAASMNKVYAERGNWDEKTWDARKERLYTERNCAFVGQKTIGG